MSSDSQWRLDYQFNIKPASVNSAVDIKESLVDIATTSSPSPRPLVSANYLQIVCTSFGTGHCMQQCNIVQPALELNAFCLVIYVCIVQTVRGSIWSNLCHRANFSARCSWGSRLVSRPNPNTWAQRYRCELAPILASPLYETFFIANKHIPATINQSLNSWKFYLLIKLSQK